MYAQAGAYVLLVDDCSTSLGPVRLKRAQTVTQTVSKHLHNCLKFSVITAC